VTQQRLADLRYALDDADGFVREKEAQIRRANLAVSSCLDRYTSLQRARDTVMGFKAAQGEDAVNPRLVAEALGAARADLESAKQAQESPSAGYSQAVYRREALRATLRAAEYLAEREAQR